MTSGRKRQLAFVMFLRDPSPKDRAATLKFDSCRTRSSQRYMKVWDVYIFAAIVVRMGHSFFCVAHGIDSERSKQVHLSESSVCTPAEVFFSAVIGSCSSMLCHCCSFVGFFCSCVPCRRSLINCFHPTIRCSVSDHYLIMLYVHDSSGIAFINHSVGRFSHLIDSMVPG
jgi:hypothetical protein